jgi:hypothetical protein
MERGGVGVAALAASWRPAMVAVSLRFVSFTLQAAEELINLSLSTFVRSNMHASLRSFWFFWFPLSAVMAFMVRWLHHNCNKMIYDLITSFKSLMTSPLPLLMLLSLSFFVSVFFLLSESALDVMKKRLVRVSDFQWLIAIHIFLLIPSRIIRLQLIGFLFMCFTC